MFRIIILVLLIFWVNTAAHASIIFQDNFDDNCTGTACLGRGATTDYPTGWDQWGADDAQPVTVGGATHDGGEITAPGRNDTGKSLKIWRYNNYYGNYTGALYLMNPSSTPNHFWMRYYMRVPLNFFTGSEGFKQWRFNVSGGGGELYLNFYSPSGLGQADMTLGIYDNNGWNIILDNDDLLAIWDNTWHCFQFEVDMSGSPSVVRFYLDGTLKSTFNATGISGNLTAMQHFPVGNSNDDHTWVNSNVWSAMEVDDLIIATTKAETDPDEEPPAITGAFSGSSGSFSGAF